MILTPPNLRIRLTFSDHPRHQRQLVRHPERGWWWGCPETKRFLTIVESIRYARQTWDCEIEETNAEGEFIQDGPWVTGAAKTPKCNSVEVTCHG